MVHIPAVLRLLRLLGLRQLARQGEVSQTAAVTRAQSERSKREKEEKREAPGNGGLGPYFSPRYQLCHVVLECHVPLYYFFLEEEEEIKGYTRVNGQELRKAPTDVSRNTVPAWDVSLLTRTCARRAPL